MFNRNTTIQTNTMDSFLEAIINKKKAEIQAKFNVYDEQRLGYIKIQEFKEKLKKLGLNPETTAIKQQLAAYEKIGSIDLLEFTKLLTAKKTVLQKALQNELASMFCCLLVLTKNRSCKLWRFLQRLDSLVR